MDPVISKQHIAIALWRSGPLYILSTVAVALVCILLALSAPSDFAAPRIVTIEEGSTLTGIARELKETHVIRSETLFNMFAITFAGDRKLPAGDYAFEHPALVYDVAWRIARGSFGISRKKVTIPEGTTVYEAAAIFERSLAGFDRNTFLGLAEGKEGYLFPDTYFFFSNTKPVEIIRTMEDTFDQRITELLPEIERSGKTLDQIITMASIIEREADKSADRRVVSGILWKRIKIGMALQVDAAFLYAKEKTESSREVTLDDLKMESDYNTYTHRGLTPTPIGNPGLDAITAALRPDVSPYLYYLHGADGAIHYARTFEEHKENKRKYLK